MRYSNLLLIVLCSLGMACGQMLPGAKPLATPMADSTGTPLLVDFNIKLAGIKDANMPFSVFSQRPLMIYYFGPHCPHCKKHYSGIQQIAKEYEQKGLTSIAVSVGGNISKRDILMFMEQQKASIPFFQDAEGDFGKKYGDGYVPRLYLIFPDGKIVRYTAFESEDIKGIKADIEKLISK
jgi:thiol-disulfide isomerase/thioredoxin